jgi:hypothetical protein
MWVIMCCLLSEYVVAFYLYGRCVRLGLIHYHYGETKYYCAYVQGAIPPLAHIFMTKYLIAHRGNVTFQKSEVGWTVLDCRTPLHPNIGSLKSVVGDQTQLRKGALEYVKLPPSAPQIISSQPFIFVLT